MKKQKKKPVIMDQHGARVLIECIAGWHYSIRNIKVYLRSGGIVNMSWSGRDSAEETAATLETYFNVVNGGKS